MGEEEILNKINKFIRLTLLIREVKYREEEIKGTFI